MAEQGEHPQAGAGGDPAGAAIALGPPGALDPRAAAYLEEQIKVARAQERVLHLQAEDLKREDMLRHWSLVVRHVSDILKLALEFSIAFIVLMLAAFLCVALWTAAHDGGLIVDAFSVPPDLAAKGLNGQAVAAQLKDKLAGLQDATDSARQPESYADDWGDDIKVQIPDTGVSIGEFYRYLAEWLGHRTHVSGEIFREGSGIAITARAGTEAGATVKGADADLDALLQQAAEAVYARTQPYRYSVYLDQHGRIAEEVAILNKLALEGPTRRERGWATVGLGIVDWDMGDFYAAVRHDRRAVALMPEPGKAWVNLEVSEDTLGHDEQALAAARAADRILHGGGKLDMTGRATAILAPLEDANVATYLRDYPAARAAYEKILTLPDYADLTDYARAGLARAAAELHDDAAARAAFADLPAAARPNVQAFAAAARLDADFAMRDWSQVLRDGDAWHALLKGFTARLRIPPATFATADNRTVTPYIAAAEAALGQSALARKTIDSTALDCYDCLRMRGLIAARDGGRNGAADWFARAARFAPSLPDAYADWGAMLLHEGRYDSAIAKFDRAHAKGPHFADPLEMWGEALMQKNRSDLALAKFAEAAKYAPNWGRLHLKWGEALAYAGDRIGARKQFAAAAGLDLTPSDKSELARMKATHG